MRLQGYKKGQAAQGSSSYTESIIRSVVYADHDGSRLDHGIGFLSNPEAELFDGTHRDRRTDDVAAADIKFNDAVNSTFLDFNDRAFQLIACAQFHVHFLSIVTLLFSAPAYSGKYEG